MKKKLTTIFVTAFLAIAMIAAAGCNSKVEEPPVDQTPVSGNVILNVESVVFTANSEVLTLTDKTSLKDYMDVLAKNGELVFGGSEGDYGFYIESVYGKKAEGNNFWAVYTDLTQLGGVSYSDEQFGTFTYGDKTLYSASYGVSGLPCVNGYTYALVYSSF